MNKISHILVLVTTLFSTVLISGCADEPLPGDAQLSLERHSLQVTTSSITFGSTSGLTQTLSVTGENTAWVLADLPTWLSASPASGNGETLITLTAETNNSGIRSAVVTLSSTAKDYAYSKSVTVRQMGATPDAESGTSAEPTTLVFGTSAQSRAFSVTSNEAWTAVSSASWCTASPASGTNNGTVTVTVTENTSTDNRTATITVSGAASGDETVITVTQQGLASHTSATPDALSFEAAADTGGKTITITSNESWTASSSASWCKITPTTGTNNGTVTVTVTENTSTDTRSATVTIKGATSGDEITVTVTQQGVAPPTPHTSATPDALSFDAAADTGGKTITVTSNESWTASSSASWCKISSTTGTNNGTVTVTVTENTSTDARSATVTIKGATSGDETTVTVTQQGVAPHTSATPGTLSFDVAADTGGKTITVTSNESWTASSSASWCKITPATGTNNGIVTVTVTENTSTDIRTATVTIRGTTSGDTTVVTVTQAGQENNRPGGDDNQPPVVP